MRRNFAESRGTGIVHMKKINVDEFGHIIQDPVCDAKFVEKKNISIPTNLNESTRLKYN